MATGWQFVLGSVPLSLAAQIFESPVQITWAPTFVAVLLVLSLLSTALAFALLGAVFFGERMSLVEGAGMALILAGVWWISRRTDVAREAASVRGVPH